ncbi:hypothetical protein [Kitasatospora sp. NPDC086791]|uniref:hypothetical protein n=1 Tax=Kitasatospora sp. NPDC086791 TaxID=3155178 RepID=UPI00342F0677
MTPPESVAARVVRALRDFLAGDTVIVFVGAAVAGDGVTVRGWAIGSYWLDVDEAVGQWRFVPDGQEAFERYLACR